MFEVFDKFCGRVDSFVPDLLAIFERFILYLTQFYILLQMKFMQAVLLLFPLMFSIFIFLLVFFSYELVTVEYGSFFEKALHFE